MTTPAYPAGLRLAGRRVLVVGGGTVAARRLPALLAAGAAVELVAPETTPAVQAMAEAGELTWHRRGYADGDLDGAWYALVATDDQAVNTAVAEAAEERRIFCARADDASRATAWTPATGRADDFTIAVLSGDPRRSAALRDAALDGLRTGTLTAPHQREHRAGVALVGGGPGDPDLITVRGRRLLAEADVVVSDHLAPLELLEELGPQVEVVDASKLPYGRAMAQQTINETLIDRAKQGKFVVRLKGGDPYVFGRGLEEVVACTEAGVPVTVVPGITSAISVPAVAGVPVTHRGVTHEFTVVSGHTAPDDPRSLVNWEALAGMRGTLVLLMAVERIGAIAETLIRHGKAPETPVAVVQEGTRSGQRRVDATLATAAEVVAAEGIRPPSIIVVGEVVSLLDSLTGR
ncbi:uroporphyrinogen-III C-methyltransferase [Phaeacidiphilus oryzae]|uniref:uroporphyrinogen-III C-methyltransferase n=1 Tax=Phaeacidiphilus oryzae TaxID=348818 RepID=UPI00055A8CEA|nr:uroporphyrinogen-III C-methyltransferase [Phaeacidiphilus oryzae]